MMPNLNTVCVLGRVMPTQGMSVVGYPECGGPQLWLEGVIVRGTVVVPALLPLWAWGRMGWGRRWPTQHGTIPCRPTAVGRDVISAHIFLSAPMIPQPDPKHTPSTPHPTVQGWGPGEVSPSPAQQWNARALVSGDIADVPPSALAQDSCHILSTEPGISPHLHSPIPSSL